MDAALLRSKLDGWRAAEVRSRQARRDRGADDPTASLEAALELCDLVSGGFSRPRTSQEEAGITEVRQGWALLRLRLRR
jgi:hypothetical protein